jgi:SAM-dependent methyltransferase
MPSAPNSSATSADFEFKALGQARNYRQALVKEFAPYLSGAVLEIGAGIGQITELLVNAPAVKRVVAVEPDPAFCAAHRSFHPGHEVIQGTVANAPTDALWNSIVSINVLEHIEDDLAELQRYAALLRPCQGHFCLFVPARPELYSPIDKDFGHFRRYTRPELAARLVRAGFEIVRLNYFNFIGYFAWGLTCRVFKRRSFDAASVRLFDRLIFPVGYLLESHVARPPIGQSLIALARSSGSTPG